MSLYTHAICNHVMV